MRLVIDITSVPEGAKTCEGCRYHRDAWQQIGPMCTLHLDKDGDYQFLTGSPSERLPECLAAERIKVRERWETRTRHNDYLTGTFSHRDELDCLSIGTNRIVHVARYRKPEAR